MPQRATSIRFSPADDAHIKAIQQMDKSTQGAVISAALAHYAGWRAAEQGDCKNGTTIQRATGAKGTPESQ